jgi:hypothetical protein
MAEALERITFAIQNPHQFRTVLAASHLPQFTKLTQTFPHKWHNLFHPITLASNWTSAATLEDARQHSFKTLEQTNKTLHSVKAFQRVVTLLHAY